VEVEIPYRATTPWLQPSFLQTGSMSNGPAPAYSYSSANHNGCITMRVQNLLTGPAVSPEIDILVYVRAGKDFMLAVPREITTSYTARDPAGVIQSEETSDSIAQSTAAVDEKVAMITTGEILCSMRPLLHRSSLVCQQYAGTPAVGATASLVQTSNFFWRIPYGVGRMAEGYNYATVDGVGVPYNFGTNHPIDWVLNCFVGYRGSTNFHVNTTGVGSNVTNVPHLAISRTYNNPIINSAAVI
jgi:hypothetical protein